MAEGVVANEIPRDVALRLCTEIEAENHGKWYRWGAWMCWGCAKFTKGDMEQRCVANAPGYRGCVQVNARYDQRSQATS